MRGWRLLPLNRFRCPSDYTIFYYMKRALLNGSFSFFTYLLVCMVWYLTSQNNHHFDNISDGWKNFHVTMLTKKETPMNSYDLLKELQVMQQSYATIVLSSQ